MLARLMVKPFGSIWKLRTKCTQGNKIIRKIAQVIYGLYQYENNSSIAWNSCFKSEPCFPHGMKSIFVSGEAKVGSNCVIYQQVTIGSVILSDAKSIGSPIIGDDVYIGSGAKIIGAVIIGNNVRIGANTVVYKDVPDNCVVVSGEQKNIEKEKILDNRLYCYQNKWVYYEYGRYHDVLDSDLLLSLESSRN